ncbi:MAG TPA: hypothetical protein VFB45_10610 [Pseudolabrys sp.]|nr:hypothetical protein [Pseudolabrys sp.]
MSRHFAPAALLAAAALFSADGAQAAAPGFCQDYATAAVRQASVAASNPNCSRASGNRWSTDFNVHYNWCLGASFQATGAERDARTNWLRACRH